MPSSWRYVALAGWVGVAAGCADQNDGLSRHFPATAARALSGDGFVASAEGFAPKNGAETDPVRAAEAALSARGGLRLQLPGAGEGEVRFQLGDLKVSARESGASGPGRMSGAAVAFTGAARTSYWTATPAGYEEWLRVSRPGDGPVASWEIQGSTPRLNRDEVELLDASGAPRIRVTAPIAYESSDRPARAWLTVEGNRISLFTSARGADVLVDPTWSSVGSMTAVRVEHTATLLTTGKVLVAGGLNGGTFLNSAELYDPGSGSWSATGSLAQPRALHAALLLPNGKVMVVGGTSVTRSPRRSSTTRPAAPGAAPARWPNRATISRRCC